MADNPLGKLPLLTQLALAIALAAVLAGAFWYFWYQPRRELAAQKADELSQLEQEVRELRATANKLQEFQRQVQVLEASLDALKRYLPPERETPDLLRKVQALAQQSYLGIKVFTYATPVNREYYQEVPITVNMEGSYHNAGLFLDRVARLQRIVNIGELRLAARSQPTPLQTITLQGVAKTYIYKEPTEPPATPATPARRTP